MTDFIVDHEFSDYMFPVDKACDEELEADLLAHGGARDKLIVARLNGKRYLIDGHRRHRICEQHKLSYEVEVVDFANTTDVFDFMDKLQLSRRNLGANEMALVRARMKKRHEPELGSTAAASVTAEATGVTPRTVYRDAQYANAVEKLSPNVRDKAVERLTQAQTIQLAKLPKGKQREALEDTEKLRAPKPPKTFEQVKEKAGKTVAQLQNQLEDVHKTKADAIRLRSAKGHAKSVGEALNRWGEDYQE